MIMEKLPEKLLFSEACKAMMDLPVINTVYDRYAEPWRAYHTDRHINEMIDHVSAAEEDGVRIHDGAAALGFILWHDAVYDPQATHARNEKLSAQLCISQFGDISQRASTVQAAEAILATIRHEPPLNELCPDGGLLLDCDLAILGANQKRFYEYNAAIRLEYSHVPQEIYNPARREVLSNFLKRDRLYCTDWAHARWEEKARENIESLLS